MNVRINIGTQSKSNSLRQLLSSIIVSGYELFQGEAPINSWYQVKKWTKSSRN